MRGSERSAHTVMVTGFHTPRDCLFSTVTASISSLSESLGLSDPEQAASWTRPSDRGQKVWRLGTQSGVSGTLDGAPPGQPVAHQLPVVSSCSPGPRSRSTCSPSRGWWHSVCPNLSSGSRTLPPAWSQHQDMIPGNQLQGSHVGRDCISSNFFQMSTLGTTEQ